MPIWFQIMTGIFSIFGVLFAVGSGIFLPIYRNQKNKITTESVVISYNAEAPKVFQGYPRPVVEAKIGFSNRTNLPLNITHIELVDGETPSAKANMPLYIVVCWLILYNI